MPDVRRPAIRVLIADDHAVVREGIRHVLSADEGFEVIAEAANGAEAVDFAQRLCPDAIVVDLTMPVMGGLEAVVQIRAALPDTRVLVLSMHDHEEYVARSVRAGAQGYLRKDSPPAELRRALRVLVDGGTFFPEPAVRALSSALQRESRLAVLTQREREVLIEIARGASNKQIAARLGISVRTVESHREALMRKLQLRGTASLTRFAVDSGLVERHTAP